MVARAYLGWRGASNGGTAAPLRMSITLPPKITLLGNSTQPLAISPDGSTIVYSAIDENQKTQLYLRKLNSFESTPITGSENGMEPFFSPDGEWVGFVTPDDKLKKCHCGEAVQYSQTLPSA